MKVITVDDGQSINRRGAHRIPDDVWNRRIYEVIKAHQAPLQAHLIELEDENQRLRDRIAELEKGVAQ